MIRSAFVLASAADLSLSLTQPNAGISWSLVFCQFYLQQPLCLQLTALFSTWKTAVCNSSLGFSHCAERQLCLRRSAKIFNCRFRATAPLLSVRGRRTFVQLSSCQFVHLRLFLSDLVVFAYFRTKPFLKCLTWLLSEVHFRYLCDRIPGQLNDRRTMLGELNWIFTAITDTIAWNTLPRGRALLGLPELSSFFCTSLWFANSGCSLYYLCTEDLLL